MNSNIVVKARKRFLREIQSEKLVCDEIKLSHDSCIFSIAEIRSLKNANMKFSV